MAPKRGFCYKCQKFQSHLRRHVSTCKFVTPSKKRRIVNVTAGNSNKKSVTAGNSDVSMQNAYQKSVTAGNSDVCMTKTWNHLPKRVVANTVRTILTERIDGFRNQLASYERAPATIMDMLMRKSVSKANEEAGKQHMMAQFPRLQI